MSLALAGCSSDRDEPRPGPIIDCFNQMTAVFFDHASTTISPGRRETLSQFILAEGICSYRAAEPTSKVFLCLKGYTDENETKNSSPRLSLSRAKVTAEYLIELGVPRENISARGFGDGRPFERKSSPGGVEPQNRVVLVALFKKREDRDSFCK